MTRTDQIARLIELEKQSTPGPWLSREANEDIGFTMMIMHKTWHVDGPKAVSFYTSNGSGKPDCEFITAAKNNLPKLLEELRVLREACEWYACPFGQNVAKTALALAEKIWEMP